MRNGRSEADLRAQRRDHEGPRVEHGAGAKRAPLTMTRARSLSKKDADLPGPPQAVLPKTVVFASKYTVRQSEALASVVFDLVFDVSIHATSAANKSAPRSPHTLDTHKP
jgi:hypothetical protein